ncbi:lipopolysaccharide core heptose(I) kinase RfaP [uncultured Desulfuromonas sp.]|uniref:lipopolysaccharide core heptose(I) kinase RfaP n=1 Tax=uncultured Desulfuromonas sp. TaxID=181013 RepID=UPI002AAC1D3C|nr:lipopolysaccharide core heptose(I) kinase RfaP [uncultured Desulfuromonas sp.]
MIVLPSSWQQQWHGRDYFEVVQGLEGEEYRNMDGRRTFRFEKDGRGYFAKVYTGLGWKRILKSLLTFRRPPVLSAANEWRAIRRLEELGVDTMRLVGYGEQGANPARRQSFIITEELTPTESLEDFCGNWINDSPPVSLKCALIEKLAQISKKLHDHGVNHRDYYLCHFLVDLSVGRDQLRADNLTLYLIDLHRVQFRRQLPQRWRLKDLAALYFSSMEIGLTQRDLYRFIAIYTGKPLRQALQEHAVLWQKIERRGAQLMERYNRKYRPNG